MSAKLTDTQLVMLSAATQRDDRCLVASANFKGGTAQKVAAKLIAAGLAKEVRAEAGTPVWRRDEQAGQSYSLKLTAAGAKAIAIDDSSAPGEGIEDRSQRAQAATTEPPITRLARAPSAPRGGSKLARVIALLQRNHGATIEELMAATGWLAHTTRAAMTGLRKRRYAVAIERSDDKRGSFYRIIADRTDEDDLLAGRAGEGGRMNSETVREKGQRRSKSPAHRAA